MTKRKMIEITKYQDIHFFLNNGDLGLPLLGGNKARKIIFIEKEIITKKNNAIVTTGGIQSNHCRVAALLCAKNGWKCKLILHGDEKQFYNQKGNALIMRLCGAEFQFVKPEEIGPTMDKAIEELINKGYSPYYLYGGGHNKAGVQAYIEATKELYSDLGSNNQPDHIFLASGTGSTQAGILIGLEEVGWNRTKVHGISVARKKERGIIGIIEAIHFIKKDFDTSKILFYDDFLFDGYGNYNDILKEFNYDVAKNTGIILDTTYTGKAFYGMLELIKKYNLKGHFLFWDTGGLLNVLA